MVKHGFIVETMKQVVGVLLVFLLSVSLAVESVSTPLTRLSHLVGNDYECNQEGYIKYLNNWSVHDNTLTRDQFRTARHFKTHFQSLIFLSILVIF